MNAQAHSSEHPVQSTDPQSAATPPSCKKLVLAIAGKTLALTLLGALTVCLAVPGPKPVSQAPVPAAAHESSALQKDDRDLPIPPAPPPAVDAAGAQYFSVTPIQPSFFEITPHETSRVSELPANPVPGLEPKRTGLAVTVNRAVSHRLGRSESGFRAELDSCEEIEIKQVNAVRDLMRRHAARDESATPARVNAQVVRMLQASRAAGLPLRSRVQLNARDAGSLGFLSKQIRDFSSRTALSPRFPTPAGSLSAKGVRELLESWRHADLDKRYNAVPALMQMLQVENDQVRVLLVMELARTPGKQASVALLFRALFDPSPEVSRQALAGLEQRPPEEYRDWLLAAFRYPLPFVADRAARIAIETNDTSTIPYLVDMLSQPDPRQPVFDDKIKKYLMRDVVRINHVKNCCLCHAPSFSTADVVRGLIPGTEALPSTTCHAPSLSSPEVARGSPNYGGTGAFVRADVTYLQQDFSLIRGERFDYLVRTRQYTGEELDKLWIVRDSLPKQPAKVEDLYPQQQAVYHALHQLTGEDLGLDAAGWLKQVQPVVATQTVEVKEGK